MFHRYVGFVAVVVGLGLTADLGAQKGGKPPKAVDKIATATFRCNGPTAATHEPVGTPCGPSATWGVPDAITGDGSPYVGVGTTAFPGTGAFLRSDGELEVILRAGGGRMLYLNFEKQHLPPSGSFWRKTFNFADLDAIDINTNVIDPRTNDVAGNGALSIPVGATWPTRIKGNWNDPYGVLYTIRFNPADYPGSTHAWVTRTADNAWTLFATDVDIARLVSPGSGKGKTGPTDEGHYLMPFEITFTVP